MHIEKSKSALKQAVSIIFRILFPISAMKKTVTLMKDDIKRTSDNAADIRDMAREAKQNLDQLKADSPAKPAMTYRQAIAGKSHDDLQSLFMNLLFQKRLILLLGGTFVLFELLMFIVSIHSFLWFATIISFFAVLITAGFTFQSAMNKEVRLWQMKNKRLSIEENGGFAGFMENKNWWFDVLNPHINSQGLE